MRQHEQADRARDQLADDPQAVHAVAVLARCGARHAEHHQRTAAERGHGAQCEQRDEARHPQRGQQVARAEQRDGECGDAACVDATEPQVRRHGREAERAEFDEEVGADLRGGQPELRRELAGDGGCHEQQQRRDGREHDERDERRAREGRCVAVGRECGIRGQGFHGGVSCGESEQVVHADHRAELRCAGERRRVVFVDGLRTLAAVACIAEVHVGDGAFRQRIRGARDEQRRVADGRRARVGVVDAGVQADPVRCQVARTAPDDRARGVEVAGQSFDTCVDGERQRGERIARGERAEFAAARRRVAGRRYIAVCLMQHRADRQAVARVLSAEFEHASGARIAGDAGRRGKRLDVEAGEGRRLVLDGVVDEVRVHRHDDALAAVRRVPERVVEQRLVEQHAELTAERDGAHGPGDADIRAAEERVAGRGRGAVVEVEALFELEQRTPAATEILVALQADLGRQDAVVLQLHGRMAPVGMRQVLHAGIERAVQREGRLRMRGGAARGKRRDGRGRADEAGFRHVGFSIPSCIGLSLVLSRRSVRSGKTFEQSYR